MPRTAKPRSAATPAAKTTASRKTTRTTTKAPVLKKSEIEAMLLSAQKKLYDAETKLDAQTGELEELRTRTDAQAAELIETRNAYYDGRVDVALAQHQVQGAKIAETTAIAEMRHMTQLLATAEANAADRSALDAAHAEIDELRLSVQAAKADKANLDIARKEASALRQQLTSAQDATKDVDALRKRVSEQDQRLAISAREMADLTKLLSETEAGGTAHQAQLDALQTQIDNQTRDIQDLTALLEDTEARENDARRTFEADVKVGRAAVAALIAPPDTMRLDQERLNRAAVVLVNTGAFDPDWYLAQNADVADSGADPALHFLEFGFAEGRAPKASQ